MREGKSALKLRRSASAHSQAEFIDMSCRKDNRKQPNEKSKDNKPPLTE